MMSKENNFLSRRKFLQTTTTGVLGVSYAPYLNCGKNDVHRPLKRQFGNMEFQTTTMGLGGQSSIQWTPADVEPVKIILKAFDLGINYYDTSNLYGPSQSNFAKAFRQLDLISGNSGYNESLRRSIFLTSKTHLRWAKGGIHKEGVNNWSNGPEGSKTVDDVKRSLSQIFGDGQGNYPVGAYLDMVLIHDLTTMNEAEALYEGIENTDASAEHIGALAALRDYRDGSNLTGLNPKEEKLIKHIGFSGHYSAPVMMEMIQRDKYGILEGMLVAINSNDRLNLNMQHNVIPVAAAKNMSIIGMKVFADGAMYSKGAHWSGKPEHVVRTVGSKDLPSRPLIQYALTTPGIHTAIIGIGQINNDASLCQLKQNLDAAQVREQDLTDSDRRDIEEMTKSVKNGKTNYFQAEKQPLSPAQGPQITQQKQNDSREVFISWHTAYAGEEPIKEYEIWRDDQKIAAVKHQPQITKEPFHYKDQPSDQKEHTYKIVTVDTTNNKAETENIIVPSLG